MKKYACLDIGGTAIKYGIINENGCIMEKCSMVTEADKILQTAIAIVEQLSSSHEICGICISTAGMVDPQTGEIIYSGPTIPNYKGTRLKKTMEEYFGLPCEVENDVNCAGLGEYWLGAAKDSHSCVCLTIGTGIGGCVIINGKVIHGFSNSAGEVGYMLINGCAFQDIAATSKLVEKVAIRKNLSKDSINGKIIFDLAKKGDVDCIKEIDNLVDNLALGISYIVYVINPEVVVLGGGIMAQKDYLKERINKALKEKLIERVYKNVKIEFAENQNNAGMLGALYNFKSR